MLDLATLKAWLGIDGDDDDILLVDLESRAVAILERETGRYFGPKAERSTYFTGFGDREQSFPFVIETSPAPVVAYESIGVNGVEWVTVDATDYQIRENKLIHNTGWCHGVTYRLTATHGYAPGNEPEDVKQAVLDAVGVLWQQRKHGSGVRSESIGGYSYTLDDRDVREQLQAIASRIKWTADV